MQRHALVLAALAAASPSTASAQFSSDIPGIPRAATSFSGSQQSRAEFALTYFKIGRDAEDDSLMFGLRVGLGRSFRIRSNWEVGFDLTIAEAAHLRPPTDESVPDELQTPVYTRGLFLYALKLGLKFRPIHSVTPEGYGYHVAFGVAYQPSLRPVFGAVFLNDSATTGGLFGDGNNSVVGSVHQSLQVAVMGGYRARRIIADAAVVLETVTDPGMDEGPVPIGSYDGIAPRVGVLVRVTPSFAVGGSFWGDGAPPWRDRVVLRGATENHQSVGFILSFGSRPEAGTDLMVMSPTGSFGESVRLFIRARGTR